MFQDIMDELQFFPLVFNFDICGFDIYIYGTLVARINHIYKGLPVEHTSTKVRTGLLYEQNNNFPSI
jgi:hypothetical protein